MSCFICKRKKKPAPKPARKPPPGAAPVPAREAPGAAPEPPREEIGPSNGRNRWADGQTDEADRTSAGLTRNMEMPSYTCWNNNRDDARNLVDKFFSENPNPRMPKPIPRSQFLQDYGLPETLMSSAETYYDYGCAGAPSFDPHPYHYGSG